MPAILSAHALIRLEGATLDPLLRYEEGVRKLLEPRGGTVETLAGVQRPRSYTSAAMTSLPTRQRLPHNPEQHVPWVW